MSRADIEAELDKFGMVHRAEPFLDFCESNGGQLDMRMVDSLACGIGPGDLDYNRDFEDQVRGDLTVVSYDPGFPRLTVQHWTDGEHLTNTFLEDCRIGEDGDITCGEIGELSGITVK